MHLPSLLAHIAKPSFLLPLIGAAVLADVVFAILALSLGIDEKSERGAATHAATLIKTLLLGKDTTLVTFVIQLLLHFTGAPRRKKKKRGGGEGDRIKIMLHLISLSLGWATNKILISPLIDKSYHSDHIPHFETVTRHLSMSLIFVSL